MTLFALPPGVDFAREAVAGLIDRYGAAPDSLARVTVYANAASTLTALREHLVASGPRLLPQLRLLADIGGAATTPPLTRELDLATLIASLGHARIALGSGHAIPGLARSLATLMTEMQREGVSADSLTRLDTGTHAHHWRLALEFLTVAANWALVDPPIDAPALQRAAAVAASRDWPLGLNRPTGPLVVIGSTGSHGASRLFLEAVAAHPNGAVVLPGYEPLSPSDAEALTEDHPQARLAALVARFGPPQPWTQARPANERRNALVALALRPAPVTDRWIADGPALGPLEPATAGLTLIEAPDPDAEAETLALVLRDAVRRGQPATLITPARDIARRVTAILDRWRLIPDDSAGVPLSVTPEGLFLRAIADLPGRPLAVDALVALLKQRPTAFGQPDHLRLTRRLELSLRRRGPAFPTAASLHDWASSHADDSAAGPWSEWLGGILDTIATTADDRAARPVPDRLTDLIPLATRLSAGPAATEPAVWTTDTGALCRAVLDALATQSRAAHRLTARDFADLLTQQLSRAAARTTVEAHPLLRIRGTREARTDACRAGSLILIAGANEGVWPPRAEPDPWLSRAMRTQLGLPTPERQLGLSTHDAQQALAAAEVVICRARRDTEAETIPARWLNRLTNLLAGLPDQGGPGALAAMRARGNAWLDRSRALNAPAAPIPPEPRPAPIPPADALTRISVTEVATLIRDPYALYARRILALAPLDALRPAPDVSDRGTIMHRIMERFLSPAPARGTTPEVMTARLLAIADSVLDEDVPWPSHRAFWRERLRQAARGMMRDEARRLADGLPFLIEDRASLPLTPLPVTLTANADRLDLDPIGQVAIYDYKSGTVPTAATIRSHDKQLPLIVALVQRGGFRKLGARGVTTASYIELGGTGAEHQRPEAVTLADETWDGLIKLLGAYRGGGIGFLSHARSGAWGTYDHLARLGEWAPDDRATAQRLAEDAP